MVSELGREPEKPTETRTTLWVSRWTHSQVEQAKVLADGTATADDVVREAMTNYLAEKAA